jgi:hypothetical protein
MLVCVGEMPRNVLRCRAESFRSQEIDRTLFFAKPQAAPGDAAPSDPRSSAESALDPRSIPKASYTRSHVTRP